MARFQIRTSKYTKGGATGASKHLPKNVDNQVVVGATTFEVSCLVVRFYAPRARKESAYILSSVDISQSLFAVRHDLGGAGVDPIRSQTVFKGRRHARNAEETTEIR